MERVAADFVEDFNRLNAGGEIANVHWIRLGNLYAVASICYYDLNSSIMSDELYDSICLYLLENLDEALKERAGGLGKEKFLEEEMLSAGSGFDTFKFPDFLHDVAHFVDIIMMREYLTHV